MALRIPRLAPSGLTRNRRVAWVFQWLFICSATSSPERVAHLVLQAGFKSNLSLAFSGRRGDIGVAAGVPPVWALRPSSRRVMLTGQTFASLPWVPYRTRHGWSVHATLFAPGGLGVHAEDLFGANPAKHK